jgi:hypothetical protein
MNTSTNMNTNTNQEKKHKEMTENIRDIIENIKEFEEEFKDYLVPGVYFDYKKFFQEARKKKDPHTNKPVITNAPTHSVLVNPTIPIIFWIFYCRMIKVII